MAGTGSFSVQTVSTLLITLSLLMTTRAASPAIATSAIVTTYTATYYSTSTSLVSESLSTESTDVSCQTLTGSGGTATTTNCISGVALTSVPVYNSVVNTLTTTFVSTIGYSTIYSYGPDSSSSTSTSSSPAVTMSTSSEVHSTTSSELSSISQVSLTSSSDPTTSSSNISPPTPTAPSNTGDSSKKSSSKLGPKIALIVAILVGLVFLSIAIGYIVKKRRDRVFNRAIGAPDSGAVENGGVTSFVAMTDLQKKPDTSVTTLATIPESRSESATPRPEVMPSTLNELPPRSPGFPPPHTPSWKTPTVAEAHGTSIFEAPPRPSISDDALPPRATSLHQRRASTESAITIKATILETDERSVCVNPFHDPGCNCKNGMTLKLERDSVYETRLRRPESFSQPRYEMAADSRVEAGGNIIHGADGQQRFEAQGHTKYGPTATPIMELEDTSIEIGTAK